MWGPFFTSSSPSTAHLLSTLLREVSLSVFVSCYRMSAVWFAPKWGNSSSGRFYLKSFQKSSFSRLAKPSDRFLFSLLLKLWYWKTNRIMIGKKSQIIPMNWSSSMPLNEAKWGSISMSHSARIKYVIVNIVKMIQRVQISLLNTDLSW